MKPIVHPVRIASLLAVGFLPAALHADEILGHPTASGFRTNNAGTRVKEGPYNPYDGRLFIGRSYYDQSDGLAHLVVPFQLPDLGRGTFSNVQVRFSTNTSPFDEDAPIARDMNLWALPDPRPFSTPLATDVYADGQNHTQRGILVKQNFLSTATGQYETVSSATSGAEATALADWINRAYGGGDRAGDFVFMRLSPAGLTASSVGSAYDWFAGYGFNMAVSTPGLEPRILYTFTPVDPDAPFISSFAAAPPAVGTGGSTTLSWSTSNTQSLVLDPGGINVTGTTSRSVSPSSTTTYTLQAFGSSGSSVTKSITVTVSEPVSVNFVANIADCDVKTDSDLDGATVNTAEANIGRAHAGRYNNEEDTRHAVFVFQLPSNLGAGGFRDAELSLRPTQGTSGSTSPTISFNLWGISSPRSSATVLASDVIDDSLTPQNNGFLIQSSFVNPSTAIQFNGSTTNTRVTTDAAGSVNLSSWLTEMYANGANASRYVFLRISPQQAYPAGGTDVGFNTQNVNNTIRRPTLTATFDVGVVPPPEINFSANASQFLDGQQVTLSWSVSNATSVSIDNGLGAVDTAGTAVVVPSADATYTLSATGPGGTNIRRVSLRRAQPGPYRYYRLQPLERRNTNNSFIALAEFNLIRDGERLEVAAISAIGSSYDSGAINLNDGSFSSFWFDSPSGASAGRPYGTIVYDMGQVTRIDGYRLGTTDSGWTEDYDIVSWRLDGSQDGVNWKTIDLQSRYPVSGLRSFYTPVIPVDFAPEIGFSATPSIVTSGGTVTLAWNVVGADSISIEGVGDGLAANGSVTVTPADGLNTYTLTAANGSFGAAVESIGVIAGVAASPVQLTNPGFDELANLGGAFIDGSREELDGWQILARQNTSVPDTLEVAVGSQDITPADGGNVLRLMAGAAVGQLTPLQWSELNEGDQLTLTLAAGDRGNTASANPRWADDSFFGFSNGLAVAGQSAPASVGWLSQVVSRSQAVAIPPGGYKSGTMGDVTHTYTVRADDHLLGGQVGVFIASLGYRDGSSSGADAPGSQSFWDRARLDVVLAPGPRIVGFSADETLLVSGEQVTFSWQVEDADEVSISNVGGSLGAAGSISVTPAVGSTTYTLTASNTAGAKSRSITVETYAPGPAVYQFFRFTPVASRSGGNVVKLAEFQILQGGSVLVPQTVRRNGGNGADPSVLADGSLATRWDGVVPEGFTFEYAAPVVATGYRFGMSADSSESDPSSWRVEGSSDGYNWSLVDERIGESLPTRRQSLGPSFETFGNLDNTPDGPSVDAFGVSASQIREGESATLSWSVSGATSISISGLGTVAESGSATVSPASDTTYYLIAENAVGRTIASASVQVEGFVRERMIASWDDAQYLTDPDGALVSEFPDGETFTFLEVGRYTGESDLRHIVIPFQLPDLGAGRFLDAGLMVRVSGGELGLRGRPTVQLFALPGVRDDSFTEPFDVVDGDDNHLSNGILIDPLFLNPATPLEQFVGTEASGSASQRLAHWLNEAYAGGANAGKFVFLRLSANALEIPEGFSFAITTGDDVEENAPGLDFTFDPQATQPAAPVIGYFNALSTVVNEGSPAILQWGVSGASSVTIDQGVGDVAASGSIALSPSATTTYTLSASDGGTPVTASVQVTVAPAETMRYVRLIGRSARGGPTLAAATSNIWFSDLSGSVLPNPLANWSEAGPGPFSPVVIDFGGFYAPASYRVASGAGSFLNDLTSWRLEGSLDGRSWFVLDERADEADDIPLARSTFSDPFYLIPGVPDITIGASSKIIKTGGSFTLSWNVTNTDTVTINNDIGTRPASGSLVIMPSASTTYTITATGADITVSKSVSVLVLDGALLGTTYEDLESETFLNPISNLIAATPSGSFIQTGPIQFNNNFFVGQPTDLPGLVSSDSFSVLWLGWFDATVEGFGDYTFGTNSDDGSVIYFDLNDDGDFNDPGELVVDNNGNHGTQERTGTVNLQRNLTRIAIAYYEAGGDDVMEARFKKGNGVAWASMDVINANTRYFQDENPLEGFPSVNFSASTASIVAGQPVTLNWEVFKADEVTISGVGTVAASGSTTLSPTSTTTYTLTASNAFGERSLSVTVGVAVGGLEGRTYDTLWGSSRLSPISSLINATPSGTFVQTAPIAYPDKSMYGALPGLTNDDDFSVLWQGWIDVSVDGPGVYTFATASKDGSAIYIDLNDDGDFDDAGELVVGNFSIQAPAITYNPACPDGPDFGWFTKSGFSNNTSPTTGDVRHVVIRWGGETIYDGPASGIVNGSITVGDFRYDPATYRGAGYGWCDSGACGTCASNADFAHAFDVSRSPVAGYDGSEGGSYGSGSVLLSAPRRIAIGYFSTSGEEIMHARFGKGENLGWSELDPISGDTTHFQPTEPTYEAAPEIIADTASLAGLTSSYGTPSAPRSFMLYGVALQEGITVDVTSPFEVSTSPTSGFDSQIVVGGTGDLAETSIYVRIAGSATVGSYESGGTLTLVSTGAASKSVSIGSSSVGRAPLQVTAQATSKTYGDADPELAYTSSGLVGSDTISGTLVRSAGENAGAYAINQGTLDAGGNYEITFTGADFTILPKALGDADITLTRNGNAYTAYAAGVAGFSYSYSGREGTGYGPSADAPSADGDYTVTATVEDPNFTGSKSEDYTIGGSEPPVVHPPFHVTDIRMAGTVCTMVWDSQPGASYVVEATDNPADPQSWTALGASVASQGATTTVTIDIANTSQAGAVSLFMRVKAQRAD